MTASISKEQRTRGEDYQAPTPVPKAKRTRGRPSEYDESVLPEVVELLQNGATSREVLDHLGVSSGTFWRWCAAYPELRSAVKSAKEAQDARVVDALRINAVLNGNVTAQIFWLKNRQPQDWRDRQEHELIVPVSDDAPERSTKELALEMLGMLNDAVYAPDTPVEQLPKTLDLTANAREETEHDHDTQGVPHATRHDQVGSGGDPDFDLDPGEL